MNFEKGNTVGIDLGTTFSSIAQVNENGEPAPIENEDDDVETASLILLAESGHVIVGPNRNRAAMEDPENVVERIKRHMGVSSYKRTFDGREITPEFISALILKKLKQDAEKRIGTISNAVITVPYYFNDTRRKSTQDAGKIAGFNVVDIINEPTAATLTYAWHRGELGVTNTKMDKPRRILVYDLGGGTFDSTVVEYTPTHFHVLATDGDVKLGGVDWNDRLADHVLKAFQEKHGIDASTSAKALQVLRNDCDLAKIQLTTQTETAISFRHEGKSITVRMTRDEFDQLTADLLQRTADTTEFVLEQADLEFGQLDAIVLVGGSTLMPQVPRMLKELTGLDPYTELDPHTAVAKGASIHAAILEAKYRTDNTESNEKIRRMFEGIHQEDVNSHGLGIVAIEPKSGKAVNHIMIPRNTTLPYSKSQTFQTNKPNQSRISVQVLEGDAPDPIACSLLGKCRITGLPNELSKGTPVEVTYSFDKSGRISVSAREKTSNNEANIEIERKGALTDEQVDAFVGIASEYVVE
ncbi:MAG: Hsp70 family protein [Planctomycetaceae bacterium]|jgi:molecular chaperone DnaK|nr:Hsp70 family protein [Planctomycetaceae bacterium]